MTSLFRGKQTSAAAQKSLFQDVDTRHADKLRGGFYTPTNTARWLCEWAIRSSADRILEPSAGNGSFLLASASCLAAQGATNRAITNQLTGVEIDAVEAAKAADGLARHVEQDATRAVSREDFFGWLEKHRELRFDCVVGNPPFIRYQNFPEPSRSRAMRLLAEHGFRPNKLTNIWVPFVVGASDCLAPGGRLALVLPAELLQVSYAAQLRGFLIENFKRIDIFACNELIFPGAQQEVVLLLADDRLPRRDRDNRCQIDFIATPTVQELMRTLPRVRRSSRSPKIVQHENEKWLKYFLSNREIGLMRRLRNMEELCELKEHASIDVGVVTGENSFFVLPIATVRAFGLTQYCAPLIGRSAQLKGAIVTRVEWQSLASEGHRVYLLNIPSNLNGKLSELARRYIREGEERDAHVGYKCSIRKPWYSVPAVWAPHCFFFRQIYDFPRIVLNDAGATSTDTIHRMTCKCDPRTLVPNLYTHLTAASAEIEGRSYGGGVLELEPTEAERLLVPRRLVVGADLSEIDELVRAGRLKEILAANDRNVLMNGLGLSTRECAMLRGIWTKMRDRRIGRRRPRKASATNALA